MLAPYTNLSKPTTRAACRPNGFLAIVSACLLPIVFFAGCEEAHLAPTESYTAELRPHPLYEPAGSPSAQDWKKIRPGLHGSFGSINVRYDRDVPPRTALLMSFDAVAWRGERLSAQLVLWTSDGAGQVSLSAAPLRNESGSELPASSLRPAFVRYVLADDGSHGCGPLPPDAPRNLVADVIDTADTLDISPRTTRPVWLSIDVPTDAEPGQYTGQLIVSFAGGSVAFEINLEVLSLLLPQPSEWKFHLDLWQNPWAVARYHNVKPWSKEHFLLLEPLLKMLADAGQKCITTTIVHHPWGGQTYDPYDSMIEWVKNPDGTWSFDYSVFDDYVRLCTRLGIKEQISCYSMAPWGNNFRYLDAATGSYQTLTAEPGTEAYNEHWRPFIADFAKHLEKRGWLGRTAIAMDERDLPAMQAVIDLIKNIAPDIKIAMAGHYFPAINDDVDNLCIFITHIDKSTPDAIALRKDQNQITTFYVCCANAKPNNFTYSPPAESAWLGWYAAAMNFDGNLRWAYNSWVADPLYDTSHVTFQAADCFFVYPGARSSIRFERLREGIQDYEKIPIVRKALEESNNPGALQTLDEMLTHFTYQDVLKTPAAETVNEAKKLLTNLSKQIASLPGYAAAPTQKDKPSLRSINLIPDKPGKTPNYWCTWGAQNYASTDEAFEYCVELKGHFAIADTLTEKSLFHDPGWAKYFQKVQKDMFILYDLGWDTPPGVDFDGERWRLGTLELVSEKFPSCTGTPAERLWRLNELTKAAGWRGAAIWLASQAPGDGKDDQFMPQDQLEQFWRTRAQWTRHAGIEYWKVDYGARGGEPEFRKMLTDIAAEQAPGLIVEHARGSGPVNDEECPWDTKVFNRKGSYRTWGDGEVLEQAVTVAEFSDILRTYDVTAYFSIPTTLDRVAQILAEFSEKPGYSCILNCEDEPYIAAALGTAMGILRHPLWRNEPGIEYDPFNFKNRIDEVTRAVRWHRIAPAFPVGSCKVTLDDNVLMDTWRFRKYDSWATWLEGREVLQTAPARVARGLPLPEVTIPDAGPAPYVIASRNPNGAVAVATLHRVSPGRGAYYPLADVTVDVPHISAPVGIFGRYRSLTLKFPADLGPCRIYAQDLAGDRAADITTEVNLGRSSITLPGRLIENIGLADASPGDLSEPALVLKIIK